MQGIDSSTSSRFDMPLRTPHARLISPNFRCCGVLGYGAGRHARTTLPRGDSLSTTLFFELMTVNVGRHSRGSFVEIRHSRTLYRPDFMERTRFRSYDVAASGEGSARDGKGPDVVRKSAAPTGHSHLPPVNS